MIDGKLLDALIAVVKFRSFEKAAAHLGITQSAVSQRIQSLESTIGKPLIIRSPQTKPTPAGERMVRFAQQIEELEKETLVSVGTKDAGEWAPVAIGVNADSLATWFKDGLASIICDRTAAIELMVGDQSETIDLLRAGAVLACVSSWAEPIQGCSCTPLGKMTYRCVASRDALARCGTEKLDRKLAGSLPAVVFGRNDDLVADYVKKSIGLERHQYPSHVVPSTADLLSFVIEGFGYSLLPALQIEPELRSGQLIDINPKRSFDVNLYWHRWKMSTAIIEKLSQAVEKSARARLA